MRHQKILILALDPFESATDPSPSAVAELNAFAGRQDLKIQPVYAASPSTADLSLGNIAPVAELEKKLEAHARNLGFAPTLPARVLVDETGSQRGLVKLLLGYAAEAGADTIALTSHGRSGLDRFMIGSFAEAVLRESTRPVIFLPNAGGAKRKHAQPTIFFATDFSPHSRRMFDTFLAEGRLTGCHLVIFHSINFPTPYAPVGTSYIPENFFSDQEKWAKTSGEEWRKAAATAGYEAELIVHNGGMDILTGREILAAAEEAGADLIVMASASGALERLLFGSVAFEIFRSRRVPTLVYGPRSLVETKAPRKVGAV